MKIAKNSKEALDLIKKAKKGNTIIFDERQKKEKPRIKVYLICNNCDKKVSCLQSYNCCSKKCAEEYLKRCKKARRWL